MGCLLCSKHSFRWVDSVLLVKPERSILNQDCLFISPFDESRKNCLNHHIIYQVNKQIGAGTIYQ